MKIFSNPTESAAKKLLSDLDLPTGDITAEHLEHFFGCSEEREIDGVVGLEICGEAALLRSLAVVVSRRGSGLGVKLVAHAEEYALNRGVQSIFLLTIDHHRRDIFFTL